MDIQLLLTGDELMSGDTVDTNSAYIAQTLKDLGLRVSSKLTVGDNMKRLCAALASMSQSADVLLVNGGLGPTVDDLTAEALGVVLDQPLVQHRQALEDLSAWAATIGAQLNDANLKQTYLPASAQVIHNSCGSACGFSAEHNGCLIICTPGVPRELFAMLEQQILPLLQQRFDVGNSAKVTRLRSFGIGESSLQEMFKQAFKDWPKTVELGFRVDRGAVELKVTTLRQQDAADNLACSTQLRELLKDHIFGSNNDTLASVLIDILRERGQTVTTVESCTGGMIASAITQVAGASDVFETGFVTYSNDAKQALVGVDPEILAEHGAVSEATVKAMVAGALNRSHADFGIAVSGIAGPSGGSADKPVGTVWIAWGTAQKINARRYVFNQGRAMFQTLATHISLDLLRRDLLGLPTENCHFSEFRWQR